MNKVSKSMAYGHYLPQEWKHSPSEDENSTNGCFDCNICLDFACEPVVTHCGHLCCWPCIYKWLHLQTDSLTSDDEHPQCPVCEACISSATIIPLYGREQASLAQSDQYHDEKASLGETFLYHQDHLLPVLKLHWHFLLLLETLIRISVLLLL